MKSEVRKRLQALVKRRKGDFVVVLCEADGTKSDVFGPASEDKCDEYWLKATDNGAKYNQFRHTPYLIIEPYERP